MDTLKTDLGGEVFMKNGENGEHFYGELVERLAFFTMNTSTSEYVPRASAAHTSP